MIDKHPGTQNNDLKNFIQILKLRTQPSIYNHYYGYKYGHFSKIVLL